MVCTTFSWHSLKFYVTDHLAMIGSLSQGSLVVTTCLDFYRLISRVLFLRYKSLWTPFVWWMHDINCRELSISLLRSHDFRNSCSIYVTMLALFSDGAILKSIQIYAGNKICSIFQWAGIHYCHCARSNT